MHAASSESSSRALPDAATAGALTDGGPGTATPEKKYVGEGIHSESDDDEDEGIAPAGGGDLMEEKIRIIDELEQKVGGRFQLTALLQKRVRELIRGASPLIETRETNPIKIAFLEMERGLIELIPEEEKPLI